MLDRHTEYKRSFSVDGSRMAPQRRRSLNWALGNEQKLGMGGGWYEAFRVSQNRVSTDTEIRLGWSMKGKPWFHCLSYSVRITAFPDYPK